MNKVYRLIWSAVRQCWIVAAEKVTAKGGIPARTVGALAAASLLACGSVAHALPSGNNLVAGQATVSTPTAGQMQINQTSNRAVINWNSFGIAKGESVNISQPSSSSALLNRVIGNSSSEIYGSLTANGQVFLINPNGVLFGKSASVNVGGLVASSLNITDTDFMNNNLTFYKDGSAGSVSNQGSITAGFAALLGPTVDNSGSIITYKGSTVLAGADAVTLNFDTSGLIALTLDQGAYDAQVQNSGIIEADAGRVILTAKSADSILKSMVNNSGIIRARSVDTSSGEILLLGDRDNGTVSVGGTLDATGGSIETSAHDVTFQSGALVKAKSWLIDPTDITIDATTAATLVTSLDAGTDITETTSSSGTDTGNITVASAVSWIGTGTLTLTADNNIAINADISATNGTLKLLYGQGTASGSGSSYSLGNGAQVSLSSGNHFYTQQGSSGGLTSWYVITDLGNAGDENSSGNYTLQGLANNGMLAGHYVLGADIDASVTSSWNSGAGFNPIGNNSSMFTGSFNGLGHTIDSLYINRGGTDFVGLFGYAGNAAIISNVGLTNVSVTGHYQVGGLTGINYGSISNSYVTGSVSGSDSVGGLVGLNDGTGSISASYAAASVNGDSNVGGLVGENFNSGSISSISDSYATGNVSGNDCVGGLVGHNYNSISNSYATGSVSGYYDAGGLVGVNDGSISNSYFDTTTTGRSSACGSGSCSGVTGLTTAQLAASLPSGFDSSVWGNAGNQTTPYLLANASFSTVSGSVILGTDGSSTPTYYDVILTAIQLQNINNNLAGKYVLGADIDASATATWNSNGSGGYYGFTPIGNYSNNFTGSFNGLGHTIGNLYINRSSYFVGLFGYAGGAATISNVGLTNVSVSGGTYVGGLVGENDGSISNSYATGNVSGGYDEVGGLVGYNSGGSISDSYATASVSGSSTVGGLVGENSGGSISASHATGNVSGSSTVGGLVGSNSGSISTSYATGNVSGSHDDVGGLVGGNDGSISNSYATGNVSGGYESVGGLVGWNDGSISTSYATGDVTGSDYVGGLVGTNGGSISDSYATGDVTGSDYVGGLVGEDDGTVSNSFYNIDSVSINGSHLVGPYGIYDSQLQAWLPSKSLSIGAYFTQESDGYYEIGSIQNLRDLLAFSGNSAYNFRLTNNLDLNNSQLTGTNWYIPVLSGTLDGNNHILSNLTVSQAQSSYIGLVGYLASGAAINKLGLTNVSVSGNDYVGGLVGWNDGSISASYATGSVSGGSGSISKVSKATVKNDSSTVGGLVGYNAGSISDSYATASVSGGVSAIPSKVSKAGSSKGDGGSAVGGLVGVNGGSISNSYATASVSGYESVGGLVGGDDDGTVSNSFYDIDSVSINGSHLVGPYGIYNSQFQAWLPSKSLSIGAYFTQESDGYYEIGSIQNLRDLLAFSGNSAYNFRLTNNLDLSSGLTYNWYIPILSGTLDGNNHILSNLTVNQAGNDKIGLVGYLASGAAISKLGLTNVSVSGSGNVGGLVGWNDGSISNSYATGSVSGYYNVGGLVGDNVGSISNSYATASVSGSGNVGGLVGWNDGSISNSYATGSVSGYYNVGGLVGDNVGSISNSYATASVSGYDEVGGLVGDNGWEGSGTISNSYATGSVSGTSNVGGLVGDNGTGGTISGSYFDTTTTGQGSACGTNSGTCDATGLSTANMKSYSTFNDAGWDISDTGGSSATWRIYEGYSYPLLRSFLTALTISGSGQKIYDGTTDATSALTYSSAYDASLLLGTLSAATSSKNVGDYSVTPSGLYSTQQGYDISYASGTVTITAKTLTISGTTASDKTYDGTKDASVSNGSLSGVISGETVSLSQSGSFSDKNVGTNKTVTVNNTLSGTDSGNYVVADTTTTASITAKAASVSGTTTSVTYNGTTQSQSAASTSGFLSGDDISVSGLASGRNAGTYTSSLVVSGTDASNYTVSYTNADLTIAKKDATVTGTTTANDKTYDGTTTAAVSGGSLSGVITGDSVTFAQSGSFSDKNVGSGKTVTYSNSLSGSDSGNYTLVSAGGTTTASITPAALTVTANNATKIYDGSAYSGGNGVSYSGLAAGDTASVLSGTLTYSGSSQGATVAGSYVITPGGLSGSNYSLSFVDGTLTIRPVNSLNDQLVPLLSGLHPQGTQPLFGQGQQPQLLAQGGTNGLIVVVDGGVGR